MFKVLTYPSSPPWQQCKTQLRNRISQITVHPNMLPTCWQRHVGSTIIGALTDTFLHGEKKCHVDRVLIFWCLWVVGRKFTSGILGGIFYRYCRVTGNIPSKWYFSEILTLALSLMRTEGFQCYKSSTSSSCKSHVGF